MPNLSLKDVPQKLYLKLKKSAKDNRRSLNGEIIFRLEQVMGTRPAGMKTGSGKEK